LGVDLESVMRRDSRERFGEGIPLV